MKLLNDERINLEDGEVKLAMRPVTTSQQARLAELAVRVGITARIEQASYCLKSCIEKISVAGVDYDPVKLADGADISDDDTLAVMLKLGRMVADSAFARDEDLKK